MFEKHFDCVLEILPYLCTTHCTVEFKDKGVAKSGGDKVLPKKELKCHHQKGTKRAYGNKSVEDASSGTVYFMGDAVPELKKILGGTIWIDGEAYSFDGGKRWPDADGKIIYTEIDLI